ncbi:SpoIIE family protein phosphatase [bacterium]|nr:SpoIIE family protein phosphatase [bacterium]
MEFLLIIGAIWFISYLYQQHKEKQAQEEIEQLIEAMAEERRQNIFTSKVESKTIEGEEFDWDVFQVTIKGIIDGPNDNFKAKYIIKLKDVTNDDLPIYSTLEEFQQNNSRLFWYESDDVTLPYETTVLSDWIVATNIPKMFLEFPRSGSRKLKFEIYVVDSYTDNILIKDAKTVTYYSSEKGYQDKADDTEYFEEMVIKSAMLVSASDGHIDIAEANVVKSWIKIRISIYNDNFKESEKERLNGYIKDASREIENNTLDFKDILEGIDNIASEGEKFELFEVCLDVAKADGEADPAELKIANDIQTRLLPKTNPQINGFDIAGKSVSAKEVGGDYFDIWEIDNHTCAFTIADVSGKGVPAALMMVMIRTILKTEIYAEENTSILMKTLNSLIIDDVESAMFATIFLARLDSNTGELRFTNGGHNYPMIFHSDREEPDLLETTGFFIGMFPDPDYEELKITIKKGDTVVLYTDGITEASNSNGEMFGMGRFCSLVSKYKYLDSKGIQDKIIEEVQLFAGEEQDDDITLVILKYI